LWRLLESVRYNQQHDRHIHHARNVVHVPRMRA
jgi:hypothetical protein